MALSLLEGGCYLARLAEHGNADDREDEMTAIEIMLKLSRSVSIAVDTGKPELGSASSVASGLPILELEGAGTTVMITPAAMYAEQCELAPSDLDVADTLVREVVLYRNILAEILGRPPISTRPAGVEM